MAAAAECFMMARQGAGGGDSKLGSVSRLLPDHVREAPW